MVTATRLSSATSSPTTQLRLDAGRPVLDVVQGERPIIQGIAIGIRVDGQDLGDDVTLLRSRTTTERGSWYAPSGKAAGRHEYEHTHTVHWFRHASGTEWQLHLRAGSDGVALRYEMEIIHGVAHLEADLTTLPLEGYDRAWVLDYQTWYETPRYGVDLPAADVETGFPVLLRGSTDDVPPYVLLSESGIDGRFCGAHLRLTPDEARVELADASVEIARGTVTPWRAIVVGDLADVVETRFIDELAPAATTLHQAPWVRPGRAAWSWWSDFYSGAQLEHQRRLVDAAAELGWEHLLIDCGWVPEWVPEIVEHASRYGIQVHLWTRWYDLNGPTGLEQLELWRSWGVAGIKVDFMESESKDRYRWYDAVLAETARVGLMVNFHGSVIPRGWERTWPQVVGYEGIRGAEYYVFFQDTPLTAEHNVIQPFTRNVVGSMDYTPVAFSAPGRETSEAHELALAVAYQCAITHFADDIEQYRSRPAATRLLAELAPVWDQTLLLAGDPDTEAVVARRSGDRWFIGAIATGSPRTLTVPLHRMGEGPWQVWAAVDGPDGGLGTRTEDALEGALAVDVARHGGFTAILAPVGTDLFRATPRPRRPAVTVEPAVQLLAPGGVAHLRTDPAADLRLPPGWTAEQTAPGAWNLQAHRPLAPGQVAVVTVERPAPAIPAVGHARVVVPLTPGEHLLSTLAVVSFTNESGPFERDMSNGGGNPGDGERMRIDGVEHDDGIGVSSPSRVTLHLGRQATQLQVSVGIDDETPGTRAVARVLGDGTELDAVELSAGTPAIHLDADLRGVEVLELVTEPVDGVAHVDWASGRVLAP